MTGRIVTGLIASLGVLAVAWLAITEPVGEPYATRSTTTTETPVVVPATAAPSVTAAPTTSTTTTTTVVPVTAARQAGGDIEQMIRDTFGAEADVALRVFRCESSLNPTSISATDDHGIAQINRPTWSRPGHHDPVADWIGRHWADVYDPATNLEMARRIRDAYGWQMWSCF